MRPTYKELPGPRSLLLQEEGDGLDFTDSAAWAADPHGPSQARTRQVSESRRRRTWAAGILLVVAVSVVALLVCFQILTQEPKQPTSIAVRDRTAQGDSGIGAISRQSVADEVARLVGNVQDDASEDEDATCEDALVGSDCFRLVTWAKTADVNIHPGDYRGLTAESSFKDFQMFLHTRERAGHAHSGCPRPCGVSRPSAAASSALRKALREAADANSTVADKLLSGVPAKKAHAPTRTSTTTRTTATTTTTVGLPAPLAPLAGTTLTTSTTTTTTAASTTRRGATTTAAGCRDAVPGQQCYVYVMWAMRTGIFEHPQWYHGLHNGSTFVDFQALLHKEGHGECSAPCGFGVAARSPWRDVSGAAGCSDPETGDQCFQYVSWAKDIGVKAHPEWYSPLNASSTFMEFQILLHDEGHGGCDLPCVAPPPTSPTTSTMTTTAERPETALPVTTLTTTRTATTSTPAPTTTTTSTEPDELPMASVPAEMASRTSTAAPTTTSRTITRTRTSTLTVTSTTTRTTTSTVTTTITTTTTTCLPWRSTGDPAFFCFSVMQVNGTEKELLQLQWKRRQSIFACDDFAVISAEKTSLGTDECGNHIWTWVNDLPSVPMGVLGQDGVATSSYLNTQTFIMAWDTLMNSGKFWKHDFVVKVDPDCVFFPDRLRKVVAPEKGTPAYYPNCKWDGAKLFGALEVFSVPALQLYSKKVVSCKQMKWEGWGEDLYMQECMKFMKVPGINSYQMVGDERCQKVPCWDPSRAAYHPYKDPVLYEQCFNQSQAAKDLAVSMGDSQETVNLYR